MMSNLAFLQKCKLPTYDEFIATHHISQHKQKNHGRVLSRLFALVCASTKDRIYNICVLVTMFSNFETLYALRMSCNVYLKQNLNIAEELMREITEKNSTQNFVLVQDSIDELPHLVGVTKFLASFGGNLGRFYPKGHPVKYAGGYPFFQAVKSLSNDPYCFEFDGVKCRVVLEEPGQKEHDCDWCFRGYITPPKNWRHYSRKHLFSDPRFDAKLAARCKSYDDKHDGVQVMENGDWGFLITGDFNLSDFFCCKDFSNNGDTWCSTVLNDPPHRTTPIKVFLTKKYFENRLKDLVRLVNSAKVESEHVALQTQNTKATKCLQMSNKITIPTNNKNP